MKRLDPKELLITFHGIPLGDGWADGDYLTITPEANLYDWVKGTDGSVTIIRNWDESQIAKLMLQQSSDVNQVIMAIVHADRATGNGAIIGPFTVTDLAGTTLLVEPEAFIMTVPEQGWGREVKSREWTFGLPAPTFNVGGN